MDRKMTKRKKSHAKTQRRKEERQEDYRQENSPNRWPRVAIFLSLIFLSPPSVPLRLCVRHVRHFSADHSFGHLVPVAGRAKSSVVQNFVWIRPGRWSTAFRRRFCSRCSDVWGARIHADPRHALSIY